MGLRVLVLGPTAAEIDGTRVPLRSVRQRRLLAALALWRQGASADRLADAVWGDALPQDPPGALANQVSRLRAVLGDASIDSIAGGYRLGSEVGCDVDDFTQNLGDDVRRQVPYEDLEVDDARVEAGRIAERLLTAQEKRAETLLHDGDPMSAVDLALAIVAEHPLRERAAITAALALAATGRRVEGLRLLDQLRIRFVDQVGVDPSSELVAVHRRLLGDDRTTVRRRPVHASSQLIGRDHLIAEALAALRTHRLVTITGPGGIGKTALAIAICERAATDVIDFIPLAGLRRGHAADDVAGAIAARLDIDRAGAPDLLRRLTDVLTYETGILVLDNAEHVLQATATAVDELLARTPVRVLLTTRVRLARPDEHVIDVPPLHFGHDAPACNLFLIRARNVRPGWDPPDMADITEICRHVDGIPLAIELAAAHLATRTIGEISADLSDPVALLADGVGGRPGLGHVISRSLDLLDPTDRTILAHAAAFAGGFTAPTLAQACRDVAGPSTVRRSIDRLVQASLLTRTDRSYGTRYGMLDTIRAATSPDESVTADRHAHAICEQIGSGSSDAYGPDESDWAERLVDEHRDVIAAVDHLLATGDLSAATQLAVDAYVIGIPRRHVDLSTLLADVIRTVTPSDAIDATLRVEALGLAADAAAYGGDAVNARRLIDEARRIPAPPAAARYCDAVAADLALYDGDIAGAVAHLEQAGAGFHDRGQHALAAWMRATVPLAHSYGGHPDDQVGDAAAALAETTAIGCPSAIAFARYVYAEVLRPRDIDEARRQHEEALVEALSVDAHYVAGLIQLSLATDAIDHLDITRSSELVREAVSGWQRLGNWAQQAVTLRAAARLLARLGHRAPSVTILSGLENLTEHEPWGSDAATIATTIETARCHLRDSVYEDAAAAGCALDRAGLVAFAVAHLEQGSLRDLQRTR